MSRLSKQVRWGKRVSAFERSGLTRTAWCARGGVATATLDYWRRRLREDSETPAQRLMPIVVEPLPRISHKAPDVVEIELAGLRLRADPGVDAAWLWVGACGVALQPLVDALRNELNRSRVIPADETPVQMLAPGNGTTKTAYLFAYRRGEMGKRPIIVFDFATSRSGSNARRFLEHYGGALVVDDYAGYKQLFQSTPMREIGCWAHAPRNFFELHAANKSTIAAEALTRIGALYDVEREARDLDTQARHDHRQQYARPKAQALFDWLTALRPTLNNGAATAKAVDYLLRRQAAFTAYLDDGAFPIDNNSVENAIRPIAMDGNYGEFRIMLSPRLGQQVRPRTAWTGAEMGGKALNIIRVVSLCGRVAPKESHHGGRVRDFRDCGCMFAAKRSGGWGCPLCARLDEQRVHARNDSRIRWCHCTSRLLDDPGAHCA